MEISASVTTQLGFKTPAVNIESLLNEQHETLWGDGFLPVQFQAKLETRLYIGL